MVVAVCIIGTASAYGYVQWRLGQIHHEHIHSLTAAGGGKPFTLLIVGSDSRSALAANDPNNAQFGSASQTPGQRSDTIILARVAPSTRQVMLLSLPRDLWVDIPGHGTNRINSAFDTGADLLVQAIQGMGIPINHFVEVNFDSFQSVANAVGGVSFYFPTPAKDNYSLLEVPKAGCVLLSGQQALAFVRARHYEYYQNGSWHFEAESDLARIQRQQAFIKKLLKKAEGQFTNPIALNDVIAGITKNLTVDSGFSTSLLLQLARDFHSIDPSTIPSLTLPNYPFVNGAGDVLGLQQPQAAQTIAAFNSFGTNPAQAPVSTTTSTTAPKKKSAPTLTAPAVTVAPSSVSVEVANGTGVNGQAGQMTAFLGQKGYNVTIDTLSPGNVATTEILYAPDAKTAGEQIAASIPGGATLSLSQDLVPTPYNVEVVTGATYTSATGGTAPSSGSASSGGSGASGSGASGSGSSTSASSSAPSSSTTSPTTVPGTNAATYVLPGMPAGETPPTC